MDKILAIIPARFSSSRFKGKPLVDISGKPMIQRVYNQVGKAIENVVVATDNKKIFNCVLSFNGNAVMTSKLHNNGTERCREALEIMKNKLRNSFNYVINVQGDEPFIQPEQIKDIIKLIKKNPTCEIATLIKRIYTKKELIDPNVVKVVKSEDQEALYFSRSVIPHVKDLTSNNLFKKHKFYKHIGIYIYRADTLKKIASLPKTELEEIESLEQLRWLANGFSIYVKETEISTYGIDTPEDLKSICKK